LFQVMFVLHNTPQSELSLPGLTLHLSRLESGGAKYDLTLSAREATTGLQLEMEYNTDVFEAATIERMLEHFQTLLESCVDNPDRRLSQLALLNGAAAHLQLVEWNASEADYDRQATIHSLFEEQAAETPGAVAVACPGEELTYGELERRANQLAHYLRTAGVGPEVRVGLCLERSPRLLVGLLGILKSGGVYVPLDPAYPAPRLAFMLADAAVPILVTEARVRAKLPPTDATVVCLDVEADRIQRESQHRVDSGAAADQLAYVIYTSGSTGRPKGVQISHRAVVNFLISMRRAPGLERKDIMLAVTTLAFDIAGLELLLPLTVGARVVIAASEVAVDGRQLADLLARSGATVMQATPASWHLLVEAGWAGTSGLKALCGGEALPPRLAEQLLTRCASLWNLYGPTETTIWSAARPMLPGIPVGIGRPIANTQLYLLDRYRQPVPIGVPGEVYIAGTGLARGYLNLPGLTAERFLPNPFSEVPGARMYRTGDLARYRSDGTLEFLGRIDHQVKLRGFRIELGEVEAVLTQHPAVHQAVALVREDTPGDKRLIAWVVPAPGTPPVPSELRSYLQQQVPEHMLPSTIMLLETMPLTPGGKLDRLALPSPDRGRPELIESYLAPRTALERMLTDVWTEVLGIEQVGVHDNFFELGGHSLLAMQVVARVREACGVELPLRALFEEPTVAGVAAQVQAARGAVLADQGEMLNTVPGAGGDTSGEEGSTVAERLLQDLERLSDEEAERLLAGESKEYPGR
jgi:amino acid adenylation domain-containing protein